MDQLKNTISGNKSQGSSNQSGGDRDMLDKGVESAEQKMGMGGNTDKMRGMNEQGTDQARGMFEKSTGKNVPDKLSR